MDSPILRLIIEKGPREGEVLEFSSKIRSSIKVGRVVKGNTVAIKEDGISSKHLSICFTRDIWVVMDHDSSNGTKVNAVSLQPLTSYELRDGDVIKIGEYTSIRVELVDSKASGAQLCGNSRRGGAPECSQEEGLGEAAADKKGAAKRRVKGSMKEDVASGVGSESKTNTMSLETVQENAQEGVLVKKEEKRRGRGRPKLGCNQEEGKSDDVSVAVSSDAVTAVSENAEDVRRRLRPRKKEESVSLRKEESEVLKIDETKNADAPPQRRLRSRNKKNIMNMSELEKIKEMETVEAEKHVEKGENVQVQRRVTRARGQRKKNEQGAPPDAAGSSSLGKKDEASEVNKSDEKDLIDELDVKDDQEASQSHLDEEELAKNNTHSEKHRAPDSKARGLVGDDGLDGELGGTSQEAGSNWDHREKDNGACESLDLEKMTLGEWFDYLERYLPKQINAVTDQVIADLRNRSQEFHEFMLQLQKKKGDLQMG